MGIFAPATIIGRPIGGYQIARSLRFRSNSSAYLARTFGASPTTRTKCHVHCWVKHSAIGAIQAIFCGYDGTSATSCELYFDTTDAIGFQFGGATANLLQTTALYRDPGAWYCIDLAVDTTQATAA